MTAYSQKWCIVGFIDRTAKGSLFLASEWPLHCTIAPAFGVDAEAPEVIEVFRDIKFNIRRKRVASHEVVWGATRANLVEANEDLLFQHQAVINSFLPLGIKFVESHYTGENNTPHVTAQRSGRVQEGEQFTLKSVGLIDMFPDDNHRMRQVVELIELV